MPIPSNHIYGLAFHVQEPHRTVTSRTVFCGGLELLAAEFYSLGRWSRSPSAYLLVASVHAWYLPLTSTDVNDFIWPRIVHRLRSQYWWYWASVRGSPFVFPRSYHFFVFRFETLSFRMLLSASTVSSEFPLLYEVASYVVQMQFILPVLNS